MGYRQLGCKGDERTYRFSTLESFLYGVLGWRGETRVTQVRSTALESFFIHWVLNI